LNYRNDHFKQPYNIGIQEYDQMKIRTAITAPPLRQKGNVVAAVSLCRFGIRRMQKEYAVMQITK